MPSYSEGELHCRYSGYPLRLATGPGPGLRLQDPLRLRLIRALLRAADNPDRDFLLQAEKGLPVGILHPLPRTFHVFEEQIKRPLDREPWEPGLVRLVWVPNYSSTEDHREFARDKFEEEIKESMMEKMPMEEFVKRYGESRAIAALAVIVEDEEKGKKSD